MPNAIIFPVLVDPTFNFGTYDIAQFMSTGVAVNNDFSKITIPQPKFPGKQ